MAEIRWTLQGIADLQSIADFIAKDSPHYARLFVVDVFNVTDRLSKFPKSGRIVPELMNAHVREVILGQYRIVYRLRIKLVEILTVCHGAQLFDPLKLK